MQRTLGTYEDRFGLGFILAIVTCLISFFLFYERFFLRSYFKNRKAFIKVLESGECELVSSRWLRLEEGITEYVIRYRDETFCVWHWEDQNRVCVDYDGQYRNGPIGLFVGSLEGLIQTKKIIKLVTNLK